MRRKSGISTCAAAFGAGLLVAMICPPKLMLVLAAAALVIMGCSRIKN